ncbi:urease accessory protein UreD [Streptomyces sp. NPDC008317]|uniref:urease accessory protein UreD n=1 Tax=Streptomyces sp. NPDC008317 TaxID=3364827 RepID=UPI0036EC9562
MNDVAVRDTAHGVVATARIVAAPDGHGGTALPVLAGDGPLALRRSRIVGGADGEGAGVMVVGAMSAPLGGDRLRIEAEVGQGARLAVGSAAATVSLPGRDGGRATYDVRLTVRAGGALRWLPEPVIAAHRSDLRMTTRVDLAPGARLLLRDEQILGRHAEPPGRLSTRLTAHLDGRPLLDQELRFGPGAPTGWDGPAVLGRYRAVGQLLLIEPGFADLPAVARTLPADPAEGRGAVTPLAGPAALITAVAADGLRLRRLLDAGLAAVRAASAPAD